MQSPRVGLLITSATMSWLCAVFVTAAVCNVPSGTHPSIQSAIDDAGCTEVVLAAQTFVESVAVGRSVSIAGGSTATTIVDGRFVVNGSSTEITLNNLTINAASLSSAGCFREGLDVTGGATLTSNALVVINGDGDAVCLIFGDGFETGTTDAWATTFP